MNDMLLKLFLFLIVIMQINNLNAAKNDDQLVYASMIQAMKPLKKKYNMSLSGIGGSYDKGFTSLNITIHRYGDKLTKDEARRLIIFSLEEFLEKLNEDKKISQYMHSFPIQSANVSMIIINYDRKQNSIYHPYIEGITFCGNKIFYATCDPKEPYKFFSEEKETYDEALAIIKAEGSSNS